MGTFTITKTATFVFILLLKQRKRKTAYLKGCSTLNYQPSVFSYEVFYQGISTGGKDNVYTFLRQVKSVGFPWLPNHCLMIHTCIFVSLLLCGFCGCSTECYTADFFFKISLSSERIECSNYLEFGLGICKLNNQ